LQSLAVTLIIAAAFLHAGWNLLAKASKNTAALMWWATVFGMVGYGVWLASGPGVFLNSGSWLPFSVSALCEAGYFVALVQGYSKGDLSLVYPISRGSAPILAALLGVIVLAENLPWMGYFGVGLMVVGIYVTSRPVGPSSNGGGNPTRPQVSAVVWALASGIFISIYSVSDKLAVAATPPLVYNWWVFAGNAVLWAPFVWRRNRFKLNIHELQDNWRNILATSVMSVGAYAAALTALSMTSASYVVAGRGLSVVIGAVFGSLLLRERFGRVRIFGAILMVVGLGMIAFS
jgi:drug/metabolite transporter (DMT)-like permease